MARLEVGFVRLAGHVVTHAAGFPLQGPFVASQTGKLRAAAIREHRNVDGRMKTRRRRYRTLPHRLHQAQGAKIFEHLGTPGPGNLTILHAPQCFEYRFVGIRRHLASFSKCSYDTTQSDVAVPARRRGGPRYDPQHRRLRALTRAADVATAPAWAVSNPTWLTLRGGRVYSGPRTNVVLPFLARADDATLMARWLHARSPENPYITANKLLLSTLLALFVTAFMLWRNARRSIAAAAAVAFWLLAAGWVTQALLDWAQPAIYRTPYDSTTTHTTFTRAGAGTIIVMLGSGTEFRDDRVLVPKRDAMARIVTVSKLYRRCRDDRATCRVIVSGGNPQRHPASEADTYLPYLLALGVARKDIVLENTSLTTYQNARNVAAILQQQRYDSLMLVTSAYQMPRAMLDFHRFGYAPLPVVSNVRYAKCGWLPRLSNLVAAETALHELVGIAQFHVYRRIGWF